MILNGYIATTYCKKITFFSRLLVDTLFLRLFLSQHVTYQNLPADPGRMRKNLDSVY